MPTPRLASSRTTRRTITWAALALLVVLVAATAASVVSPAFAAGLACGVLAGGFAAVAGARKAQRMSRSGRRAQAREDDAARLDDLEPLGRAPR